MPSKSLGDVGHLSLRPNDRVAQDADALDLHLHDRPRLRPLPEVVGACGADGAGADEVAWIQGLTIGRPGDELVGEEVAALAGVPLEPYLAIDPQDGLEVTIVDLVGGHPAGPHGVAEVLTLV